ncbi:class I SAM-dependent methyltransferase [Mucilaginibacter sp. BT774]|uniref:class I SAM-dependent methyltransferase n=1 Tax=Mucilaginibacter sp. BT774 TaxID=3062276 RepID=UPI002676D43A|nr:class I SAM-dependent methyltransferase [Mucilaginibacter sp. BT774]MDO3628413.1 class I SAM-dependent methyltransferase [Mucilaginibacter sp. BT774]
MEKKEAYQFTNNDAENYDHYLGPLFFEPYGRYTASQIDAAYVSSVLEIACGTGRVTRHLRKVLPPGVKLFATDISADMLQIAKRELNNNGIIFQVEDAQKLSFADDSFDVVICQFGVMFLPDKKKGFEEILRVLKPGGKFIFFTWDDTMKVPVFKALIDDLVLPYFRDEDTTRFKVPFAMNNPKILGNMITDAGFKHAETKVISLKSGITSPDFVVDGFFRKHPLGREIMTKAPSEFELVAQQLHDKIVKLSDNGQTPFQLSALMTTGIK